MLKKTAVALVALLSVCLVVFAYSCGREVEREKFYVLTYKDAVGGVTDGEKVQTVKDGETGGTVIAIANDDYVFCGWSDGVETAERRDVASGDISVTPVFKKLFTVTESGTYNGVTLYEETTRITDGEKLSVKAKALTGYVFRGFSDGTVEDERTETVTADAVFQAEYELEIMELPVVFVLTEDNRAVTSREDYLGATVDVFNTETEYRLDGKSAGIRGRGNTSWLADKKSYRIKFDKKTEMFGCGYSQKSWTLIANCYDKSLMRNYIAYELAERFDGIAFSSVHIPVDFYLNGEYMGVYLVCDQIQTGKGRVDITEDLYEDGDTGYLLELDGRASQEGVENIDWFTFGGENFPERQYAIKTPDTEDETYDETLFVPFVKDYLSRCVNALNGGDWNVVTEYIDAASFVDTYIIQELFANTDVGFSSFFIYKDRGGKLFAGPVWDFDIGGGNCNYGAGNEKDCPPDGGLWAAAENVWYSALLNYAEFKNAVRDRLSEYNQTIFEIISILDTHAESGIYAENRNSFERNFEKWQVLGRYDWPNPHSVEIIDTLSGQIEYLRLWLTARYYYLTEAFG